MKAWTIGDASGLDSLRLIDRTRPEPGYGEVAVRTLASSLNYRDLMTVTKPDPARLSLPLVPNSDAAGEIVAIGDGVRGFSVGDRIATCFFQDWDDGPCTARAMASALGGALPGVLAEELVLPQSGIVPVPHHLSDIEAATLPCAAVTAWNAVMEVGRVKPGCTVLLLGTGGVSIFALQFAVLAGARVIITSSSDEKLERARRLGAKETVNYRSVPDWEKAVLDLTDGSGVDLTVEVGGAGTLPRSIEATRVAGTIALIGVLTDGEINPRSIMRKSQRLQGVYVGSRRMFTDMNRAIAWRGLEPVVDEVFAFADAPDAYRAMQAAGHFGKIVVSVAN